MHKSPWRILAGLTLTWGATLASSPALAGWLVEQKVSYGGTQQSDVKLTWKIGDKGEFRLDVAREKGDVKIFLFNGRVFYGCGKLDKGQLDLVKKLELKDKSIAASLEKGVCQEMAADFGVKFFLSPHDAIAQAEISEGFAVATSVEEPTVELTGTVDSVAGTKCVNFTRSFTLGDRNNPKLERTLNEKACNAATVKWRMVMVKELGKTLIRQPGGTPIYKAMSADLKKMAGLTLSSAAQIAGKDDAGKAYSRTVAVTTSSLKDTGFGLGEFQAPAGYTMLDAQSLALSGKGKSEPGLAKLDKSENAAAEVVLFFLRGGNPAGILVGPTGK